MYEIFELLCNQKGIRPYKFCKDMVVSTSTVSTWKKNNSQCRPDLAEKVCNYFGVSLDYLMTGKEISNKEKAIIDVQLSRQPQLIKEYMLKFANLSEEKRNQIMSLIDMLGDK